MQNKKQKLIQKNLFFRVSVYPAVFLAVALFFVALNTAKAVTTDGALSLTPSSRSTSVGGPNVSFVATINPGSNTANGVNAVQIDLIFDPAVVHLVSITPVAPFTAATTPSITNANTTGILHNAAFFIPGDNVPPSVTTTHDVATLVFSPQGGGNNSAITFDTDADALENTTALSVLGTKTGATVTVTVVVDTTAPNVSTFNIPGTYNNLTLPITNFVATDAVGVTGYCLTEVNVSTGCSWSGTAPTTFTFGSAGAKTLYAWAKDAAGNVSTERSASVNIDTTAPNVDTFNIPGNSSTLTIPISTFIASDASGIAGYMLTEFSAAPTFNAAGWAGAAPTSYTFTTVGSKILYAWAKDAANNVSGVHSASVVIDLPPVISASLPTGTLPTGTTQATVSFTTDENAICAYASTLGVAYDSMTNFILPLGTAHSFTVTGLANGNNYAYFVRCKDSSNNANVSDYLISFSVANPVVVKQSSSHHDSKKSTPDRTITNSKSDLKNGQLLTQRGKKFSKNSIVLMYFSKFGGVFYAPVKIKTSSTGSFMTTYRVNKPKGTYTWYVVDPKSGKKSKIIHYHVK